jgi:hypothetical protein
VTIPDTVAVVTIAINAARMTGVMDAVRSLTSKVRPLGVVRVEFQERKSSRGFRDTIVYPKTSCSLFLPSHGTGRLVCAKPAAISKGLWARFWKRTVISRSLISTLATALKEVAKDVLGFGGGIAVANAFAEQSIQTAGHQGQLQIATDLHGHRRGQGVHVEEIQPVGDPVFDEHALCVPSDEVYGGATQVVGEHEGGLLVAQIRDDDMADRTVIVAQRDGLIQNPRCSIRTCNTLQLDAPLGRGGLFVDPPWSILGSRRRSVMNWMPSLSSRLKFP